MSTHEDEHDSHGNSTAAWVSTMIMLVAAAVICWAIIQANTSLAIAGGVAFLIGALLWPILAKMGYGEKNPVRSPYA
ncbi:HGxxPAAW family protein [Nostocoides australiense]|uniref:Uncharacterized protein n=1 Tax=Nostocoides australiense Ben110 TaxID=1193182 RepID=W6JTH9_9MICO|nr:HGxxPAAW family protein [Tetrasphaera australiensis]MCA0290972.1 hypothetical protein [Actinomycetota bacterium]MCB1299910.1 hypothetical protein [Tetrasphaera sp.]CCH72613.1 hypothetical protein BN11_1800005 [Tetrasphaera australiensis Ben110]HPF79933.1 HGxxPAAW family protein [Tetrasphaera australiensis]HRW00330.1 HGxxPAAW family protein [Tetrasphaera sp.]